MIQRRPIELAARRADERNNRRDYRRVPVRLPVKLIDWRRTVLCGWTGNISRYGLWVLTATPPSICGPVEVWLIAPNRGLARLRALVVHHNQRGVGLMLNPFDELSSAVTAALTATPAARRDGPQNRCGVARSLIGLFTDLTWARAAARPR